MTAQEGGDVARGQLRIYLGAAPGVGKTYAMLDEAGRRLGRGTDVVIGFVETYGRAHTAERVVGLPVIPRKRVAYRGTPFEEMDLDAIRARRPRVVLVDELAHTNVPGSGPHAKRWQDVESLLEDGIDVISTLNIQHLESLNDVVERITGVHQHETLPDAIVRAADQVELVDMTPEALRRRMAHGNVYPAEKVDAALGNYFRPGNLTALRELALLWLADSVEDGLRRYREQHGITEPWETKERIVVAITGGPEGETVIRRAARISARTVGSDLLAVHVSRSDGLAEPGVAGLAGQRLLVEQLGGSYHSVIGDDVPRTLLDFARRVDATQLVLGASRRNPVLRALFGAGTAATVTRLSGPIDVHLVSHDYAGGRGIKLPALTGGLTLRRRMAGLLLAVVLLPLLTLVLTSIHDRVGFAADVPIYLLAVVIVAVVGGFVPALLGAVAASLLLNYFFVRPLHTFTISQTSNIVALVIFLLIAALVSRVVDLAARRSRQAARASAEAETLSTLAGSLLRGEQALAALLDRVRETFGADGASLLRHDGSVGWVVAASTGSGAAATPADAVASARISDDLIVALSGRPLPPEDQRVLTAFAAHVAVAYRQRELAELARAMEPLAESDRQRTALLNAVSHDLRTPIAAAKAAISSLRAPEVSWTEADQRELLETAEQAIDRLTELLMNLLDLSRLQADALPVLTAPVGLDDIVARALEHAGADRRVRVDVSTELPEVVADAGLLERVIANVVQNALRYSPLDDPVLIAGSAHGEFVELRVVDRGPGIPASVLDEVFQPFQRGHDAPVNGAGVGLGLAIARGFTEAMGGTVHAEETPGGGATVVIALHAAQPLPAEPVPAP
jgi:two-component system sensor histidine kinase KdpD